MPKDLLQELSDRVESGQKFYINFYNQTLKVGGEYLILNGTITEGYSINIVNDKVLEAIENLYYDYQYSVPSEWTDRNRTPYFKAKDSEELPDAILMYGLRRDVTQALLEGFVLAVIVSGFEWQDSMGSWYWKSKKYNDLVLLREWFEGSIEYRKEMVA